MMRAMFFGVALCMAGTAAAPARAADALENFDDYVLHSFAILQCHPSQTEADRAFLARADAVRKPRSPALGAIRQSEPGAPRRERQECREHAQCQDGRA